MANDNPMIEAASLPPCPFCHQLPERMGKTNYRNNVLIVCRGKDCPINGVVVPADKWPSESCDRCEWLIGGLTMCYSVYGIPSIECYLPKTVVEREKQRRIDHPFQDWHTLHAARQQTDIAVRDAVAAEKCRWECEKGPWWDTGCDRSFAFFTNSPQDKEYTFCPGCGAKIEFIEE